MFRADEVSDGIQRLLRDVELQGLLDQLTQLLGEDEPTLRSSVETYLQRNDLLWADGNTLRRGSSNADKG